MSRRDVCFWLRLLDGAAENAVCYKIYEDQRTVTVLYLNVVLKCVKMCEKKIKHFLNYVCVTDFMAWE